MNNNKPELYGQRGYDHSVESMNEDGSDRFAMIMKEPKSIEKMSHIKDAYHMNDLRSSRS